MGSITNRYIVLSEMIDKGCKHKHGKSKRTIVFNEIGSQGLQDGDIFVEGISLHCMNHNDVRFECGKAGKVFWCTSRNIKNKK